MKPRILWITLAMMAAASPAGLQGAVKVVVHPQVTSAITAEMVTAAFTGKLTKWPEGSAVRLAVLAGGPVHEEAVKAFTDKNVSQFDNFWKRLVFTGQGAMPKSFASEEELLAYVAATPGAVGYIGAGTPADGVRVVD